MKRRLYGWTDYPITELGDACLPVAPVRPVVILDYDGDKYATVMVGDAPVMQIKRGYIYRRKGRAGEVSCFSHNQMMRVQKP